MQLLTKQLQRTLPSISASDEVADPIVRAHFFNPSGVGDWYIVAGEPSGGDYLLFGLCDLGYPELGYVSLNELASVRCPPFGLGVERDKFWSPKPLSQVRAERGL